MRFLSLYFRSGNSYSLRRDTKRGFLFPQIVFDRDVATRNEGLPDPCEVSSNKGTKEEGIDMATNLQAITFKDWEVFGSTIAELISNKSSFAIVGIPSGKQSLAVEMVERAIESRGMKCRVRTANRGWAVGALTALTFGGAAIAAAAVGAHNLATKDPDYEIVKEMFGSDIQVEYVG